VERGREQGGALQLKSAQRGKSPRLVLEKRLGKKMGTAMLQADKRLIRPAGPPRRVTRCPARKKSNRKTRRRTAAPGARSERPPDLPPLLCRACACGVAFWCPAGDACRN